jgi:DNA-binding NarL/FixJ family response regulator
MQMPPSKDGPLRVLAVVHNRILREGICCLLDTQEDLERVGAFATAEAALLEFTQLRPELTLLDLDEPADAGLHAIGRIREIDPAAWIIALITDEADERRDRAVAAGASTVVAKHLIGKLPWRNPPETGQGPPKTGGSNTRSIGVLNALLRH